MEGVTIKIFADKKEEPLHTLVTKQDGSYRVGPLSGRLEYRYKTEKRLYDNFFLLFYLNFIKILFIIFCSSIIAEKEGYVISGPDKKGQFSAHKLAEIIVEVHDQASGVSLQVLYFFTFFKLKSTNSLIHQYKTNFHFSGSSFISNWRSQLP